MPGTRAKVFAARKQVHAMNHIQREINAVRRAASPNGQRTRNHLLNEAMPRAVVASLDDPARLCPMLAGAAVVRGARLTVRHAGGEVAVAAPASLLRRVVALCDGTRTIDEVLQLLPARTDRAEFAEFLQFLLGNGALIDANLATAAAARYAFQGSPFGLAASARLTNQICRRFLWNDEGAPSELAAASACVGTAPLDDAFSGRLSGYTFDEAELQVNTLHLLAWSLAGVVRTEHERVGWVTPRRTIASAGGMQLVKVYLALRRAVGSYAPGMYRVMYPAERTVHLVRVGDEAGLLPRAFGKPWEVSSATGAVFLAADPALAALRYRNRALQYLFMEAGAILHNGGLSAAPLGLGYATIGGYYEDVVAALCGLAKGELVLGSAIFGPKPTPAQLHLVDHTPEIDFAWVDGTSARFAMPFHLARARVRTANEERPYTWGRDTDASLACLKAVAEAIEREGFREPRGIVDARQPDLPGALDPRDFVRYTDAQYADTRFPYVRFDRDCSYAWARGIELRDGAPVHVLAELVFARASLAAAGHAVGRPYTQVTSSGCAAGTDADDATRRALLEVIERDAFMRHWLAQLPGRAVARSRLPKPISVRLAAIEAAGCRVAVQRLASPWAHVCLVAAQHEGSHFTTMGTAAAGDFTEALAGALDELEARVYAWLHGHVPGIVRAKDVASTEHHFELYGLKRHFRRADCVLFPTADAPLLDRLPARLRFDSARELVARLVNRGLNPIAVDITPARNGVDQGRRRLTVVKALVPGLLPMSFGHGLEPRGMLEHVHPASTFPHPFP